MHQSCLIGLNWLLLFNCIRQRNKLLAQVTFKKSRGVCFPVLPTWLLFASGAQQSSSTRRLPRMRQRACPFLCTPLSPTPPSLCCPRSFHPSHLMREALGVSDLKGLQNSCPKFLLKLYREEKMEERGRGGHRCPKVAGVGSLLKETCQEML